MYIVNCSYGDNDPENNTQYFNGIPEVMHFIDRVRQEKATFATTQQVQLVVSLPNGKVLETHIV